MTSKPTGELLFEQFCEANGLSWHPLLEGEAPTADYLLTLATQTVHVEIKQIDADPDFRQPSGVGSRTVGSHVRQKIADARKQVQSASKAGNPSILLIHNNLDPMQLFGTESHDFLSGMYGEMTLMLNRDGGIRDSFYGRNSQLRASQNTSFSAVGHLSRSPIGPRIQLFENAFARVPLDFASLLACIDVARSR